MPVTLNRSESKLSANVDLDVTSNTRVNVNINFVLSDRDKISGSSRRSYKNAMLAQMSSYMQRVSPKIPIEVFAVFLSMSVVRSIIAVDFDEDEQGFQKSVQSVIDECVLFYFTNYHLLFNHFSEWSISLWLLRQTA